MNMLRSSSHERVYNACIITDTNGIERERKSTRQYLVNPRRSSGHDGTSLGQKSDRKIK